MQLGLGEPVPYVPSAPWIARGLSLTALPATRIPLALLPTPLHRWRLGSLIPEGVELYIKRDDLTGAAELSGEFSCVLGRPVEAENILETNQPTNHV